MNEKIQLNACASSECNCRLCAFEEEGDDVGAPCRFWNNLEELPTANECQACAAMQAKEVLISVWGLLKDREDEKNEPI